jgi:DNA-binding beta-propeller fold protein YncE
VESPWGLAIGAGSLWVADYDRNAISRIDPRSGKVGKKPIPVGESPASIAVAGGAVWVMNDGPGTVSKVDAARGEVVGKATRIKAGTLAGDTIAAGNGKVWVADANGAVVPINAADGSVQPPIGLPDGSKALELAFGDGGLWILADNGTVRQLDPASRRPGNPVPVVDRHLVPEKAQLAVGEKAVWVAAVDDGDVVRVDRVAHTLLRIPVPAGIQGDIAAGAGYVWVIDGAGRLVQISSGTNLPVRSPVGSLFAGASDMTAGAGAVWIADLGGNRVTRVVP